MPPNGRGGRGEEGVEFHADAALKREERRIQGMLERPQNGDRVARVRLVIGQFMNGNLAVFRQQAGMKETVRELQELKSRCASKVFNTDLVFTLINGQYMFPESHAFAFGVTAYHMAWLKRYYPLEFFVAIFNQQPMGFYNLETLKEDAKRHGIRVLNPAINASMEKCVIQDEFLLLGFLQVRAVGEAGAIAIVEARRQGGPFVSLADAMERTGLKRQATENLVSAGAFDSLLPNRRRALWEVGLRYRPGKEQRPLQFPVAQDMALLPPPSR